MISSFTLKIETTNSAFRADSDDENSPDHDLAAYAELARILRDAAKDIEQGYESARLMDSDGNRVGEYAIGVQST